MRTASDVHARIKDTLEAAITAARRADNDRIQCVLDDAASSGSLDDHSVAFLRQAHALVLGAAIALSAVTEVHSGLSDQCGTVDCRSCGTLEHELCPTIGRIADVLALYRMKRLTAIDVAEAWRRANAYFARDRTSGGHSLISVEEFSEGFIARSAHITLPPPPAVPRPDSERVLILDRMTGEITVWPLMPTSVINTQYRRYKRGEPTELPHPAD
jgi:hypothetical protein